MENIYTLDGKVPFLKSVPFGLQHVLAMFVANIAPIMMFGNIVISGLQMIGSCGFSQRNITIAALSLSIGLGFTQVPDMFNIFPDIIRTIFAENCVTVVFLSAIIMNLILPKDKKAE